MISTYFNQGGWSLGHAKSLGSGGNSDGAMICRWCFSTCEINRRSLVNGFCWDDRCQQTDCQQQVLKHVHSMLQISYHASSNCSIYIYYSYTFTCLYLKYPIFYQFLFKYNFYHSMWVKCWRTRFLKCRRALIKHHPSGGQHGDGLFNPVVLDLHHGQHGF